MFIDFEKLENAGFAVEKGEDWIHILPKGNPHVWDDVLEFIRKFDHIDSRDAEIIGEDMVDQITAKQIWNIINKKD